jgi:membrane-bound lytic murein transglycosylase B
MPSTFLRLAVDFDGDGRRDLVGSVPDALASTANFLRRPAGARRGVGLRGAPAAGFDASAPGPQAAARRWAPAA